MSKKKKAPSNGKKAEKVGLKKIKPKTINQSKYVKRISEDEVIFGIGPAGTGKTLLAVDYAITQILKKDYERIIITRPVVEAGGEKLGFLPGDLEEKLDPYLRPIMDYVKDIVGDKWKQWYSDHIEVAPLAFMRGRTFNDSILILDEAQNTNSEQMKLFLTRIGYNSKAIITADPSQDDLKGYNGVAEALELFKDTENISICEFTVEDIIRSRIVKVIVEKYEAKNKSTTEGEES